MAEKKNTDIDADPIDNPPEKSFRSDLPKERAKFEEEERDAREVDVAAVWLGALLMIVAFMSSMIIPVEGLSSLAMVVLAFLSLIFNLKNTHLPLKKFPKLNFNPFNAITVVDCAMIVVGGFEVAAYVYTLGRGI